jgi:hypothetical protein
MDVDRPSVAAGIVILAPLVGDQGRQAATSNLEGPMRVPLALMLSSLALPAAAVGQLRPTTRVKLPPGPAPASVTARAVSPRAAEIGWAAVTGALSYQLLRSDAPGARYYAVSPVQGSLTLNPKIRPITRLGSTTLPTVVTDTSAPPGAALSYQVRALFDPAVNSPGASAPVNLRELTNGR